MARNLGDQKGDVVRRRVMRVALTALAASLAVLVSPAGASAGTLGQSQTNFSGGFASFGAQRHLAQTFTAGLRGNLDQVDLYVRRFEAPPPPDPPCNPGSGIVVEIRTLTGDIPSETTLASATIPALSVPTSPDWVSAAFAAPAVVTPGGRYALVLSAPDASCGMTFLPYDWSGADGNPYPGGTAYFKFDSASSWMVQGTFDHAIRTYVAVTETPPPPPPGTPPRPSERTLSIAYSEKKGAFRGKLTSQSPACISSQKVKVFEKEKGKDPKLGSSATNARGKYSLKEKDAEGRFYAKVRQTSNSGEICLRARSKTIDAG